MLAIQTSGLTKHYGPVEAVRGIDLRVEPGEVYGFLGRNGAGKTTTIRMLLGMVRPTAGDARLLGDEVGPARTDLWGRVGYLVETAAAYPELTVRENLRVAGRLQGRRDPRATDRVMERLALGRYADRRAGTLSTGNLQRLGLARALLHEPALLILDEPTVGLDPAGVVEIRDLLRGLARDGGMTVFMSSHILTEVERLADRIGIIHDGRLIEEMSVAELETRRAARLEVVVGDAAGAEATLRAAGYEATATTIAGARWLAGAASAASAAGAAGAAEAAAFQLADPRAVERPDEVARALVEGGVPLLRLGVVREDMEAFFLRLTGDAPRPSVPAADLATAPAAHAPIASRVKR